MTSAHAWLLQTLPHHAEEDRERASTWALTNDRNAARSLAEHTSGATRRTRRRPQRWSWYGAAGVVANG